MMKDFAFISVVVPIYNEEKYIDKFLHSLIEQDYPADKMEILLIDGMSTDETRERINAFAKRHSAYDIRIFDNKNKTVPYAMNIGIREAKGKYLVRLDAHAEYERVYIRVAIEELESRPEVVNVGGYAVTRGRGKMGEAIASMLSSPFGVGNSSFRVEGSEGYVDTVPFGVFRRELFDKIGGYDLRLTRNQDNEMNGRIRANNYKIYLTPRMRFTYWCRDTISAICEMARQNGYWNILTARISSSAMSLRHFVPLIFVSTLFLGLLGLAVTAIFKWTILFKITAILLLLELLLYLLLALYFAGKCKKQTKKSVFLYVYLFFIFHLNYGFASMRGILAKVPYLENPYSLDV